MRKKIDNEFIALYIQQCVKDKKISVVEICQQALEEIKQIEITLQQHQQLLSRRAKLLGLLSHLTSKKNFVL